MSGTVPADGFGLCVPIETVARLEDALLTCWPASRQILMDGWLIRLADGYSGRANSANAATAGRALSGQHRIRIEAIYRAAGLPPTVRLTPLCDAGVDPGLADAGYRFDDPTLQMVLPLPGDPSGGHGDEVDLATGAQASRQEVYAGLSRYDRAETAAMTRLVQAIPGPVATAIVRNEGGRPIGFGLIAVDDDTAYLAQIVTDPAHRGRGIAERLTRALLGWAARAGAARVLLSVGETNTPALSLYRRLGFETAYRYWYRTTGPSPDRC